jgi:hypothetical protein
LRDTIQFSVDFTVYFVEKQAITLLFTPRCDKIKLLHYAKKESTFAAFWGKGGSAFG